MLAAALFTLFCMWLGLRVAGPREHTYNLGSVELSVAPSFSGKVKVDIPLAGWEIEAPVFSTPYALHAEPQRVSPAAVRRASHGVRQAISTTKRELKHAAIIAFIRAFLFALDGAFVAGVLVMLLLRSLEYGWRSAVAAGSACLAFGFVIVGASGLWLWQSVDVAAFKEAKVTLGNGKVLTRSVVRFRDDNSTETVFQDLSRLIRSGASADDG
jgi:hypothetical protein